MRVLGTAILLLALAGCGLPRVRVESEPPGAQLHRDGLPLDEAPQEFTSPYYGVILLEAEVPEYGGNVVYRPTRQRVTVEPPVTPWIFPLDFVVELAVRAFQDPDVEVRAELQRARPPSLDDARAASLTAATRAAAVAR